MIREQITMAIVFPFLFAFVFVLFGYGVATKNENRKVSFLAIMLALAVFLFGVESISALYGINILGISKIMHTDTAQPFLIAGVIACYVATPIFFIVFFFRMLKKKNRKFLLTYLSHSKFLRLPALAALEKFYPEKRIFKEPIYLRIFRIVALIFIVLAVCLISAYVR